MAGNIRMPLLRFSVLIIRLRDARPGLYILLFDYKIQTPDRNTVVLLTIIG